MKPKKTFKIRLPDISVAIHLTPDLVLHDVKRHIIFNDFIFFLQNFRYIRYEELSIPINMEEN